MQSRSINGLRLFFKANEQPTAELIYDSVLKTLPLIQASWGLNAPGDCHIYIMTSWSKFFFQAAPAPWKFFLAVTYPLWSARARQMWQYGAAWTNRFGRRVAIGIKPPHLLETGDKSIGKLIFVEEKDNRIKLQQVTCHELTHACSATLKLPAWLNEGLAMVTVDRFLGKQTIRVDTLELIHNFKEKGNPPGYRQLSHLNAESIAYSIAVGYWLVQYLEEAHPGFLKDLFVSLSNPRKIQDKIATQLGVDAKVFWNEVPDMLVTHFKKNLARIGDL